MAPPVCYTVYNCQGESFNTTQNLSSRVGTFVILYDGFVTLPGVWFVTINTGICTEPVTVYVSDTVARPCDCICYIVTGNPSSVTYLNSDLELVTTVGDSQFCSYIIPIIIGGTTGTAYSSGLCVDGICPILCYEFTNCQTGETLIVSNTTVIATYFINNQIVTLQGHEGCWSIDIAAGDCACAINVTVLLAFDSCIDCLPVIAYKFTNCDNQSIIKYSTDDYSAYVGKTVILDCGQCWFVELITYRPPAVQPIDIITTFESCLACSRTYYALVDCAGVETTVYTFTDLSLLVGKVIKIQDCATCWEVESLVNPTIEQSSIANSVTVAISYVDCAACGISTPCKCSIAWPNEIGTLSYIDCTGTAITLTGLDPTAQSERLCVRDWIIAREPIYYGDCVDGNCPPPILPKRFIKPGYHTPTCDPSKYEKISCNAAEVLYKSVLTARYGISNCCDAPEDRWVIKKELIDLQAAMDPNYICTPVQSCCNNTPTCGCGCNGISQTTCNSK